MTSAVPVYLVPGTRYRHVHHTGQTYLFICKQKKYRYTCTTTTNKITYGHHPFKILAHMLNQSYSGRLAYGIGYFKIMVTIHISAHEEDADERPLVAL